MLNPPASIEAIERFLEEGSDASLTYAALECRLAIERICYERLRICHNYISHDDLAKWQPKDIVNILIAEVDQSSAETYTLSIGTEPLPENSSEPTLEDFQKMEFRPIGTQIGFDPKRLGQLWNALSHTALHISLPKHSDDKVSQYGDLGKIRRKVEEALSEIKRIQKGNLLSSGIGEILSFDCSCGQKNQRRHTLLKHGQTVNCINAECLESYAYDASDESFSRRAIYVDCKVCEKAHSIPRRLTESIKRGEHLGIECQCNNTIFLSWRLMLGQTNSSSVAQ